MGLERLDPLTVPLDGVRLVEASAGTGKTFTLTALHLRLLVERGLRVRQILVVTFTRAATAELKDRLRRRLREALAVVQGGEPPDDLIAGLAARWPDVDLAKQRLELALMEVDDAAVFTIHGFCQRMLQEFAFESGARYDVELLEDERPLVAEALADFWAHEAERSPPELVRHLVRRKVSPETLLPLALKVVGDPTLRVLPEDAGLVDEAATLAAIASWKAAHARASACWWAERDSVIHILNSAPLHRGRYRPKSIKDWAYHLDRTFSTSTTGPEELPDFFAKLTPDELAQNMTGGHAPPRHPFFDEAALLLEAFLATRGPVDAWVLQFRRQMVDAVRERTTQAKARSQLIAYGDLLHALADALDRPDSGDRLAERIRERYPAALIDEFQDTDPVQYRIFGTIHGSTTLFLIGDPKQAIYGFRGADVMAYLDARADAEAAYTLSVNWRSDPGLLRGVAALFADHPAPFLDRRIDFVDVDPKPDAKERLQGPGAPVELVLVPRRPRWVETWKSPLLTPAFRDDLYPQCIAADVVRLLDSGTTIDGEAVRPGDIAILVRTNNQARKLHTALQDRGVPAALQGDASVLESEEAADMEALLAALADPGDRAAVRGALASRIIGLDAHDLLETQQEEAAWELWSGRVHRWSQLQVRHGLLQAFRTVLAELDTPRRLLAQTGGERVLTNLLHLSELLQAVAVGQRLGSAGLLHWLRRAMAGERDGLDSDSGQLRLESDAGAVELVTVHRSKGLEYPIVFIPFLWAGIWVKETDAALRFHDPMAGGRLTLDLGGPSRAQHLARARAEELAENLRLLYVAVTRAEHRAVLYWGAFPGHETSALAWLLHPPDSTADDPVGALEASTADLRDVALREALDQVAGKSPDVCVRILEAAHDLLWRPPVAPQPSPEARTPTRSGLTPRRVGSYSALVRGAPRGPVEDHHDAPAPLPGAGDGQPITLAEFPRGPEPGTALHAVLEELDFQQAPPAEEVGSILGRHGIADEWIEPVTQALTDVLQTPLGGGAPALAAVPRSRRLDELAFVLPVCASLSPQTLAAPFREHGGPLGEAMAERLVELGFPPLQGFLRGAIDLIFAHDDRWWLVDHKSNHLGEHIGDYSPSALTQAMQHHHYTLQYHLYLVALHRYLGHRLPDYRYDTHIGGVRYLFLRGMSPERPGWSVYGDRPPAALIEALDALLAG